MESEPGRELPPFRVKQATISVGPGGLTTLACLNCRRSLEVHQPDAELPHRMLATCPGCKRWHLVDEEDEGRLAVLVLLPEVHAFHHAHEPAAAEASSARSPRL